MAGRYQVDIIPKYCKACRICIEVCPKNVLVAGKDGKAFTASPELCIGCKLCEYNCPDFAITVTGGSQDE